MICSLPTKFIVLTSIVLLFSITGYSQKKKPVNPDEEEVEGSQIIKIHKIINYPDNRPPVKFYVNAIDAGIIFKHGTGPDSCDVYGARDVWVWEYQRNFYMHYDGAGPKGWLSCLAVSEDLQNWKAMGPVLDLGKKGTEDCASASYGTIYQDKNK